MSRHRFAGFPVVLGLLVFVSILSAACANDDPEAPATLTGPDPDYWSLFDEDDAQRATFIRAIDGDTFEARLDGQTVTVRLFGADTPERGDACFQDATNRLTQLAQRGDQIWLQSGPRNDDGRRLLRYAFTDDLTLIDALLVREGLAEAWRRDGQLRDIIVALENSARAAGSGCLFGG